MNVKECFDKGLLKKDKPDRDKAIRSFEMAAFKLDKAKSLYNKMVFDMAIVNAYLSMFHSGRALLFNDGIIEKSHYGLYIYLSEKYSDKLEQRFLNELNALRLERHEVFYGLEKTEIEKAETKSAVETAEFFLKSVKTLISSKNKKEGL